MSGKRPIVDNKRSAAAGATAPRERAAAPQGAMETTVSDKKSPAPELNGADRNVDQIRDILFGGQMRDYERRFQELNQRIEADFDGLRQDQERRFAQLDKRLDEQVDKLGRALRQEVADRAAATDDLESRLLQGARTQRSELTSAIDTLNQELSAGEERLRAALAELEAALKEQAGRMNQSLTRSRDELRGEKVGRDDLAALLTEVALRLKGDFDLPGST
jgi:exonuclease VII large subunit